MKLTRLKKITGTVRQYSLWLCLSLAILNPISGQTLEITYLSATPFEDQVSEETINPRNNPRNIGFVLLDKVLEGSQISMRTQSIPTMRVHEAINRRTYPNWVLLAIETSDFISFGDSSEKYERTDYIFELQCTIVSHHSVKIPPYAVREVGKVTIGLVAHASEINIANNSHALPLTFVAVKSYTHGIKMLMAKRLSYLATTKEAFALAAQTTRLDKSLFRQHECQTSKEVKLLFYIDKKMSPDNISLIKKKIKQSVSNGTAQAVYDEFYGKYLNDKRDY